MIKYRIQLYNDCKCLLYDNVLEAEDENKALKEMLEDCPICSGDTIKIEEEY